MAKTNRNTVLASVVSLDESDSENLEAIVKDRVHVTTESYVWGEFTQAQIRKLRKQGFIITVHQVPALSVPVELDVYKGTTGRAIYAIGLRGPWLWGEQLEALGVQPIDKIGDTLYRVSMPGPNVENVAKLYFVYKIEQKTTSTSDFSKDC